MFDRTGREVKLGQLVEINLSGMYRAIVVNIHEVQLAVSEKKMAPPQVKLQIILDHMPEDGRTTDFYIVGELKADEAKPSLLM